jgi:hypothetical protein
MMWVLDIFGEHEHDLLKYDVDRDRLRRFQSSHLSIGIGHDDGGN